MSESAADLLQTYLAHRDVPCPGCGYNLRGLRDDRCPECNSELAITVGLVEPKQAAFVAGVVALGAGVGFHGMILLWLVWIKAATTRAGPPTSEAWPLPIGVLLCGGALWWWLRARKRLRLMKPRARWTLVAACAALTAGSAVLFFAIVS